MPMEKIGSQESNTKCSGSRFIWGLQTYSNGYSKIMISQTHLRFPISLTKNGYFVDMDRIKHIRSSFFCKNTPFLINNQFLTLTRKIV